MAPLTQRQNIRIPAHSGLEFLSGMRTRTSIVLLLALLLVSIAISVLTIQLMRTQRTALEETVKDSRVQAIALLSNRVEQVLLSAMRPPFLVLKNIPVSTLNIETLELLKETLPEVEQILILDSEMELRHSFPRPRTQHERELNEWLAQRVDIEGIVEDDSDTVTLHTFLETINGKPVIFALQRISELDKKSGWIVIRFNLKRMEQRLVSPLLDDFNNEQGGTVKLHDANSPWNDKTLNWPIGRVLPGWMLEFHPNPDIEAQRTQQSSSLMFAIASGVILTMVIATFAVLRELRREHALVELRNRFVANVSHELKTPLALIRMYAETLYLRRVTDDERQHQYHLVLLREAERLSQMINSVLDFSRLSQGISIYKMSETDLYQTVSNILESYRWQIEESGLHAEIALSAELPKVAHDRDGVTQIVINLIDNAVKYGAAGGSIEISLAAVDHDNGVELSITDHGPGIPEDERDRVRKPFQRGKDADPASGSGLGLALVEEIARIHNATLTLDTPESGTGVKATIRFPVIRS